MKKFKILINNNEENIKLELNDTNSDKIDDLVKKSYYLYQLDNLYKLKLINETIYNNIKNILTENRTFI
ncbi:MAG: hypothetical protein IJ105_04340 [Bacilli bacterium]|nr:hypothetical protein [Bacilli bacterium]